MLACQIDVIPIFNEKKNKAKMKKRQKQNRKNE